MSNEHKIHVEFPGRLLFVGFGSVGQGVLPLILRHIGIAPERLTIVTAEDKGNEEAAKYGIKFVKERLTRENFRRVLNPLLGRGDFLINVSVEVSSVALIKLCWEKGAMYLDTCIEPWPGGYTDPTVPAARRTNYPLREEALALRARNARAPQPGRGVAPGQAGAAQHRERHQRACRQSRLARRVGRARAPARGESDPHRRARHPGVERAQATGGIRQHLVHRWVRERRRATERDGL